MLKKLFVSILLLMSFLLGEGQSIKDSSVFLSTFSISYAYQIPGGDLAKRFGNSSSVGADLTFKTKRNYIVGLEFNYIFGKKLKSEASGVLDSIATSNYQIINKYGEFAQIALSERGYYVGVKIGKLFPVKWSNPNSGILITGSVGLLEHKIRIDNDANNAPQILDDYKKGYDRLTNGLSITEFIGYQHLSNKKRFNVYAGFEFYQAWTKCRRDFNFDTMEKDNLNRHDYLYTFKVGWIFLIRKRQPAEYYYN